MGGSKSLRVCILDRLTNVGGPASFQRKLSAGLAQRNIEVTHDLDGLPFDCVLVINGTRELAKLWRLKKRGIRIVQRLGGINWLHRYLPVGIPGYLVAEARNIIMRLIRLYIADHVVYQSLFVKNWWNRRYGEAGCHSNVIYNGVNLDQFNPQGSKYESKAEISILSVEGTQGIDPFDIAIKLGEGLKKRGCEVELLMFGNAWKDVEFRFSQHHFVRFMGPFPNSELPYFYRGATLYISTDIIAACPNSALEALACGTPVLGYRVGVLPELLDGSAGRCVEYRGNPWKAEAPGNVEGLIGAAVELVEGQERFHHGARTLAEKRYGLSKMIDAYCEVLR